MQINFPPEEVAVITGGQIKVTFGHRIQSWLPQVVDPEDDDIIITFEDEVNKFLLWDTRVNFTLADYTFGDSVNGVRNTLYKLVSDPLVRDQNAVLGNSTVVISWIDSVTG